MDPSAQLLLAILAPVTCGLVTLMLPRRALGLRVAVAILGPVAALLLLGGFIRDYGMGGAAVANYVSILQALR